jgi:GNAT superfamily N-acetyltransferase
MQVSGSSPLRFGDPLTPLRLPTGYRSDPAALSDAAEIHALVTACEHGMYGRAHTDLSHVVADLSRPRLDPGLDVRIVRETAGELVAWVWVKFGRRCTIDVHPAHTGRGLGSALLDWAEARARQFDARELGQTVPDLDKPAAALLRTRGYVPTVHQWLLEITVREDPGAIHLPSGITTGPFRSADAHAVYEVCEDAFATIQSHRRTYDEWSGLTIGRSTFAPTLSPLAFAGDELVGLAIALDAPDSDEGYIEQLAVRADHRGRGIAKALLLTAFRDFYRRGRATTKLWTHSKTGALSLYEHVGMTVRRSDTVYHGKPQR